MLLVKRYSITNTSVSVDAVLLKRNRIDNSFVLFSRLEKADTEAEKRIRHYQVHLSSIYFGPITTISSDLGR